MRRAIGFFSQFWFRFAAMAVVILALTLDHALGMGGASKYGLAALPMIWGDYNTRTAEGADIVPWVYWDTVTYVSGTTQQAVFFGTARPGISDLGNMPLASTLPNPYSFLVRVPRFFIKGQVWSVSQASTGAADTGGLNDAALLGRTGVFTFTIGSKTVFQAPLWMVSAGGGAWGPVCVAGGEAVNVSTSYGQIGGVNPRDVMSLWKPLCIDSMINFNVACNWPTAAVTLAQGDTAVCVALDGERCGPIQ